MGTLKERTILIKELNTVYSNHAFEIKHIFKLYFQDSIGAIYEKLVRFFHMRDPEVRIVKNYGTC